MQITAQLDDSYQTRIAAIQQSTQLDLSEIIKQAIDLLYEKTDQSAFHPEQFFGISRLKNTAQLLAEMRNEWEN